MQLLLYYGLRNLRARRLSTALTALGMGLVVFVFAAVAMLAEGLERTLVDTGSPDNAVVIRRSAETEVQSAIERAEAAIVATQPEAAAGPDGRPLVAKELVVLVTLPKRGGGPANVVIRGTGAASLALRPQLKLVAGRAPRPGLPEVMVGASVARGFRGVELDGEIRFAGRHWRIVGVFEAGRTGFASEIWGDAEPLLQAFRRVAFSSVLLRLAEPAAFERLKARVEADPRLELEVWRETDYYRKQSEMLATFLRVLGLSLTAIFSLGAVIGAMITMYAAVANRTGEIGTLRALGFGRGTILAAFLAESLLLALAGGGLGLALAATLQWISVSTINFQTFSELAFGFALSPAIAAQALGFAAVMGLAGGLLPALRAARMNLVEALREG